MRRPLCWETALPFSISSFQQMDHFWVAPSWGVCPTAQAVVGGGAFSGLAQEGQSPINSPSLPPTGSHLSEGSLRRQHKLCLLLATASRSMLPVSQRPQN